MNPESEIKSEGAFLKSAIKITHPDWTPKQIEEEYQRRIKSIEEDPSNCDMCSG